MYSCYLALTTKCMAGLPELDYIYAKLILVSTVLVQSTKFFIIHTYELDYISTVILANLRPAWKYCKCTFSNTSIRIENQKEQYIYKRGQHTYILHITLSYPNL